MKSTILSTNRADCVTRDKLTVLMLMLTEWCCGKDMNTNETTAKPQRMNVGQISHDADWPSDIYILTHMNNTSDVYVYDVYPDRQHIRHLDTYPYERHNTTLVSVIRPTTIHWSQRGHMTSSSRRSRSHHSTEGQGYCTVLSHDFRLIIQALHFPFINVSRPRYTQHLK